MEIRGNHIHSSGGSLWDAIVHFPGQGRNLRKTPLNVNGRIYGNVYFSADLRFVNVCISLAEKARNINTFWKIIFWKTRLRKSIPSRKYAAKGLSRLPSITFCTQELLEVTVEAVRMEKIVYDQNKYKQIVMVLLCLQKELSDYAMKY